MKTFSDFGIVVSASASGETDTTCPQCSAQRKKRNAKCLSVNVDRGVWHCAHCGWTGSLGESSTVVHPGWSKPRFRKPEAPVTTLGGAAAYLAERGVTSAVTQRNRIGVARVYMPQVEDHVAAIAFPYYRNGELVNVKYRDREKNFRMEAGAERVLYGYDDIDNARCVIVEGEIDKLSVETAGVTSCVSVPDGAPTPNSRDYASKFSFLDDERLEAVKEWVIAVDSDAPGIRLAEELIRRFGPEKCRRVTWATECKDANDVLRSFGASVLRECIDNAEQVPLRGVIRPFDLRRELDGLYTNGTRRGKSTGWRSLDEWYTVREGELSIVTGTPNSGKSNWLDGVMVNLAENEHWRFAVFSPENQPLQNHMKRMLEHHARIPFNDGPRQRMSPERKDREIDWLDAHMRFLLPDDESDWTIEWILKTASQLVSRWGINALVIDPWNEIEQQRPDKMTETAYISDCLRRVRQFARRAKVHVFMVAHPAKMYRDKDGKYPVPNLYDISGSAHWRNKADNGIVVYRDLNDAENPQVEIHVQKIRFREVGKAGGGTTLIYDKVTGAYSESGPQKFSDRSAEDF